MAIKKNLLEIVQVPKSTVWARKNKDRVAASDAARRKTLRGKLTTSVINTKNRAKSKGWDHNLDTQFLHNLYTEQEGLCALTGNKMTITGSLGTKELWFSISVDRIDGTKGYLKDNVQLVCTGVNQLRGTLSLEQFFAFCKQVCTYNLVE